MTAWLGVLAVALAADPLPVVSAELDRAMAHWATAGEVPHHVAIAVTDLESVSVSARDGTLALDDHGQRRSLDVDLRLGTPERDSTHDLRGMSSLDDDTRTWLAAPWDGPGEEAALRTTLWRELDARWRDARERIVLLRADQAVRVEEEDPAADFEPRAPVTAREVPAPLGLDDARLGALRDTLVRVSDLLGSAPHVVSSEASFDARRSVTTYVDTEGSTLVHGGLRLRVGLSVRVVADDGDELRLYRGTTVQDPSRLPDAATLMAWAQQLVVDADALSRAPRATPYTGPVLLLGKAAGVFVHEVMGHRVEGERNKDESEGKTFLAYLGQRVLPADVDIVDDPTVASFGGTDLSGFYRFDDQGVPAQRAVLVDDGVFRGFLMSRSPLQGFPHSNGHGRRQPGNAPAARMGNTMLSSSAGQPVAVLRKKLLAEARAQGLSFAYVVEEIDGGFTLTGRELPNAFNVRASRTWRVYVDGRPDELVRGLDLVGTPLAAFQNVIGVGDTSEVFDGVCGAESGWVPVSAVSPPLLFRRLEFQLKEKGSERAPLLPRPDVDGDATAEVSR